MAATTKKPARLTAKQQKTVDKVRDVLEAYPLGIALDDLIKETGLTAWATQQALSLVGASMRYDGLWQLPASKTTRTAKADDDLSDIDAELDNPSAAPVQDDGGNIQDKEFNTQAPKVSHPDNDGATLINTPAHLVNPSAEIVNLSDVDTDGGQQDTIDVGQIIASSDDLHPEFAQLPDHVDSMNTEQSSVEAVYQAKYLVIENCTLSLAQDGTGQEPVLVKDVWLDDEGEELKEADCQVMKRAREPYSNEVEFRGVTYRNLFIVNNAQIFHGVFDSIKAAHEKIEELTAKKRGNFFEVLEV